MIKGGWRLALAGALWCAGCAAGHVPRAELYGGNPADPSAPEERFVAPPDSLTAGPPVAAAMPAAPADPAAPYTCPMHPEIGAAGPGRCPKCGMTLIRREGR